MSSNPVLSVQHPTEPHNSKKRMQTNITELKTPHKFTVRPLKQVPPEERSNHIKSPSLHFESPYVPRTAHPRFVYQHSPQHLRVPPYLPERGAKGNSTGSTHDPSAQSAPLDTSSPLDFESSSGGTSARYYDQAQDSPWSKALPPLSPDTSSAETTELSISTDLGTPGSHSQHNSSLWELDTSISLGLHDSRSSLQIDYFDHRQDKRQVNTRPKTVSGSILDGSVKGKARAHRRKRHGIYADDTMWMSLSLPSSDNLSIISIASSDTSLENSFCEQIPLLDVPEDDAHKIIQGEIAKGRVFQRNATLDPEFRLTVAHSSLPNIRIAPILPISIEKMATSGSLASQISVNSREKLHSNEKVFHHPIIQELLCEIDLWLEDLGRPHIPFTIL